MKRRGGKKLECHQYAALDVSKHFSSSPDVSLCVYPIDGQAKKKKKKQDDKIVNSSFSETFDRKHFFWPPLRIHKRAGPINTRNEQTSDMVGDQRSISFASSTNTYAPLYSMHCMYYTAMYTIRKKKGKTGNWFTLAMAHITFLRKCRSGRHSMLCVYTNTVHCALRYGLRSTLLGDVLISWLDEFDPLSGCHKSHSSEMSNPPFTRGERSKRTNRINKSQLQLKRTKWPTIMVASFRPVFMRKRGRRSCGWKKSIRRALAKRNSSIEACFDYRLRHGWMRILIHGERKKKKKEEKGENSVELWRCA